jgi:hypothetical protein
MAHLDENKLWEIIDLVVSENVQPNEAIKTYGTSCCQLSYAAIVENKLLQHEINLDKKTLQLMTIPTLRLFIVEVITHLRTEAT